VLHRQVGGVLPLEDAIDIAGRLPELVDEISPIGDQAAGSDARRARRLNGAGNHLLRLTNEILDLSKIEAGKLELTPERVDLARSPGHPLTGSSFVWPRPPPRTELVIGL
jgi:signal transduction histidine kinase